MHPFGRYLIAFCIFLAPAFLVWAQVSDFSFLEELETEPVLVGPILSDEPVLEGDDSEMEAPVEESVSQTAEPVDPGFTVEVDTSGPPPYEGPTGVIAGQVIDAETGEPVEGVTVIVEEFADISASTSDEGVYVIQEAPVGANILSFIKSGYRSSILRGVEVTEGEQTRADFPLLPAPVETDDQIVELAPFEVEATELKEILEGMELRFASDGILDVMTMEDFSKFGEGDVAGAIRRVPGVSVVEGKFAVVRGLGDRYSSTSLNGVPVPSPDPDRQSVPLDLFSSDVVTNLSIAKSYSPKAPSNSAAGSINVQTTTNSAEAFTGSFSIGGGFNDLSQSAFVTDGGRNVVEIDFAQVGDIAANEVADTLDETRFTVGQEDAPFDYNYSGSVGGVVSFLDRNTSFKIDAARSRSYSSREGFEHKQFAMPQQSGLVAGDFTTGNLSYTDGKYDLLQSTAGVDENLNLSVQFELDPDGNHTIGYNLFYTEKKEKFASQLSNGRFPGVTQEAVDNYQTNLSPGGLFTVLPAPGFGTIDALDAFTPDALGDPAFVQLFEDLYGDFYTGQSALERLNDFRFFKDSALTRTRDMAVHQLMGSHDMVDLVDGLSFEWVASDAKTSQVELDAVNSNYWKNPRDLQDAEITQAQIDNNLGLYNLKPYQVGSSPEADNAFYRSWRETTEEQAYVSGSFNYLSDIADWISFDFSGGADVEKTERGVRQEFFEVGISNPPNPSDAGGNTPEEAVQNAIGGINAAFESDTISRGSRDVDGFYLNTKLTLLTDYDLIFGARFEDFSMRTSTNASGRFFNYSLLANDFSQTPQTDPFLNSALLGYDEPLDLESIDGEISEQYVLPAFGFVYRPIEGMRIFLNYSQTVARPSFKEFTYITTRDPESLDFVSGNPRLVTSEVESFDFRMEYLYGDFGDLLALSLFHKRIDNPIETLSLRGSVTTDTFFNNPDTAKLSGIEIEARKDLSFLGAGFFRHFSVGGNFTFIDAEVSNLPLVNALLTTGVDNVVPNSPNTVFGGGFAEENSLREKRSLVDQPEWIANADITFNHEDWGTRATLSLFAISDVLSSPVTFIQNSAGNRALPARYRGSFSQLNFTLSQRLTDYLSLGFSVKNITDSERTLFYDEVLIDGDIRDREERKYRVGRDFSISLNATF